ncbi:MAG: hypothetical protein JSW03_04365 [Candidatus Eiseniibacteriota bacterium]|nr:MAG: hypothetical protein JSW03_04365 [Candidatus Eisenbacteria bacterium]
MRPRTTVYAVVTLALLVCPNIVLSKQTAEQVQVLEPLDPIKDAYLERRHWEILTVPSELNIESKDNGTHIGFDPSSVYTVKVSVGHKMALGCEWVLYYFDGTERVELRRNMGGSLETLLGSGRHVVQGLEKIAESQGSLQLIAELTVFETDIPPQHMWMPKEGRCRALWRGLAAGIVNGRTPDH